MDRDDWQHDREHHHHQAEELSTRRSVTAAHPQRLTKALDAKPDQQHAEQHQRVEVPAPREWLSGAERREVVAPSVQQIDAVHRQRADDGESVEHREGDHREPAAAEPLAPLVDKASEQAEEEENEDDLVGVRHWTEGGGTTNLAPLVCFRRGPRPSETACLTQRTEPYQPTTRAVSMSRILLSSVLLLAWTLPATAQSSYSTSRDTLRFRETTQLRIKLTMPQGEMPATAEQRSTISLVRLPGDSAHA